MTDHISALKNGQVACSSSANRAKPLQSTIHVVRFFYLRLTCLLFAKDSTMASELLPSYISPFLRHLRNH